MIINNKILRKIYIINLSIIILLFVVLLMVFCINNYDIINIETLLTALFIAIMPIIGVTLGLTFMVINIIVLIREKK